jgi:hypothetical protein
MKTKLLTLAICTSLMFATLGCATAAKEHRWAVHDMSRPQPKVISPGTPSTQDKPGQPPSDAIVLFDGRDLSNWEKTDGGPAKWKVENGYMEIARRTGSIRTKQSFGSCQLHIEWAVPAVAKGKDQGRGNSGAYLMNNYEVQVLDSYQNQTYPDGQAGSIYGQNPPMVNTCRPPGQWQSYDIIFHRPVFKGDKVVRPATITVLQNGVLVQDNWVIEGPTVHEARAKYTPHEPSLPIMLQDHGDPVRYRNIWLRELPEKCGQ